MSAPAAKARVPDPVITTARQAPFVSSARKASTRSSRRSKLSALSASGRLRVTSATPGSVVAGAAELGAGAGKATSTSAGAVAPAAPSARPSTSRSRSLAWAALVGSVDRAVSVTALLQYRVAVSPSVPSDSIHTGQGRRVHFRDILEDEERRKSRCDLAKVAAGRPHRVGGNAGVERR